ncbi:DNA repair protein RecO [Candidatus Parcubacteria bacterium]|nr:DNA repair protein RecO [Candidatus Parcubacteria bacterium]
MSHHVYTTRGIVLYLRPAREADRVAVILTGDLGLVHGIARGARKPTSKLSNSLLEFALVRVSLVRGRHSWRITTVTLVRDVYGELRGRKAAVEALGRVLALTGKLVSGEEKHQELFDSLERAIILLVDDVGDEDEDAWELLTVARVLNSLGYLSGESLPANLLETREKRRVLLELVNRGIRSSGLYNV